MYSTWLRCDDNALLAHGRLVNVHSRSIRVSSAGRPTGVGGSRTCSASQQLVRIYNHHIHHIPACTQTIPLMKRARFPPSTSHPTPPVDNQPAITRNTTPLRIGNVPVPFSRPLVSTFPQQFLEAGLERNLAAGAKLYLRNSHSSAKPPATKKKKKRKLASTHHKWRQSRRSQICGDFPHALPSSMSFRFVAGARIWMGEGSRALGSLAGGCRRREGPLPSIVDFPCFFFF